ncbi:MAG: hypothetical protein NTX22_05910 [Ignavibacteriales bacterium]|nr:hypothetical protein [Ignavibacteriales bacterium]
MEKDIEHKLEMIKAVQFTLLTNSDITSSNSKLIETVNTLNDYIQKLGSVNKVQQSNKSFDNSEGYTIEEQFSRIFLRIVYALNSFASMVENVELMTETSTLKYHLNKIKGDDLLEKGKLMLNYAISNFPSLEHFGITERLLTDFESTLRNFSESLSGDISSFNPELEDENEDFNIDEVIDFIENTVDNQVKSIRGTFPKFYNEYQTSRMNNKLASQLKNAEQSSFKYYY